MKIKINEFIDKWSDSGDITINRISNDLISIKAIKRKWYGRKIVLDELQVPLPYNIRDTILANYVSFCKEKFNMRSSGTTDDFYYLLMGLAEEMGEMLGSVKKVAFHGRDDIKYKVITESGDLLWYFMNIITLLDISIYDVMEFNIIKLENRYPGGRPDVKYSRDEESENNIISKQLKK